MVAVAFRGPDEPGTNYDPRDTSAPTSLRVDFSGTSIDNILAGLTVAANSATPTLDYPRKRMTWDATEQLHPLNTHTYQGLGAASPSLSFSIGTRETN